MEALLAAELPDGVGWQFEPKWDGFRCLAFRDGAEVTLTSKSGKPLARYFPDVVAMLASLKTERFVLDGELVIQWATPCRSTRFSCACIRPKVGSASWPRRRPPQLMTFDLLEFDGNSLAGADLGRTPRRAREIFRKN